MSFQQSYYWKLTYSPEYRRAHLYSSECNFSCRGCPYLTGLIRTESKPINIEKLKEKLKSLNPETICFTGREPTINPNFLDVVEFVKNELGAYIRVQTNGSNPLPKSINAASISIKAYTNSLHEEYTGKSNIDVLKNFIEAYKIGIKLRASSMLIPNYIGFEEIERIAKFIASIDPSIPYHIIGFIPYNGVPWRAPTLDEVRMAAEIAKRYLENVTWSLPNPSLNDYPTTLPDGEYKYKTMRIL